MTTYKDYMIKGFDVSQWNDNNETIYFPTFDKLIERGFKFVGIRTSYGVVADNDFQQFWNQAKEKLIRIPYHYLDFYSYVFLGISPEEWGKRQARFVWSLLKNDPGEKSLMLDVENSSKYSITDVNKSVVGRIINSFFLEYDTLSKTKTGIYTNQGYLFVFGNAHKTRPLWFSWYNRSVTIERIRQVLKDWKYTGSLEILQYTSDGDIDDNGRSDAIALGMESNSLDLNVAIAADFDTSTMMPQTEDSTEITQTPAPKYVTVTVGAGIKIRVGPGQIYDNIGAIAYNEQRQVIETQTELSNVWAHISEGWICVKFGNSVLAEIR